MVHIGDLIDGGTTSLAHALGNEIHAVNIAFADMAPVWAERRASGQFQIAVLAT